MPGQAEQTQHNEAQLERQAWGAEDRMAESAGPTATRLRLRGLKSGILTALVALAGAFLFTTLVLLVTDVSPLAAFQLILFDAFSTPIKRADMIMLAAPLLLCAAGLTLTFAVGLYNLGIEGQIVLGAVFAMIPLRLLPELSPLLLWFLAFGAGALGGALWALIAALLKLYGQVSEIFAGLGLNFLATGIALYLVFGPWKRPGVASMSGTEPLPEALWLPTLEGLRLAPAAPIIALLALLLVWIVLDHSRWGLSVRATGLNPAAATRLGVPAGRRLVEALCGCGALAGIVGALQVLAVFHSLVPNISSGLGLLALLIVLLVQWRPAWVLPVVLLFAIFSRGSFSLPLRLSIDSSISGVLQGALVLFALLARGLLRR
jgi:simple sugar transport system permease protein